MKYYLDHVTHNSDIVGHTDKKVPGTRIMTTSALKLLLVACLLAGVKANTLQEDAEETANFGVRPVVRFAEKGGPSGQAFDDIGKIKNSIFNIHAIVIGSGQQVDSIQVTYKLKNGSLLKAPRHGKKGSSPPTKINLAEDEYVSKIEGTTDGNTVNQLTITTKRPNAYIERIRGPFGTVAGPQNFSLTESFILGFHGRSGDHLNSIGIYCLAPINESEHCGYSPIQYRELPDAKFPPVVKISKISLYHGQEVFTLQMEYQLHGGGTRLGQQIGGVSGNLTTIEFGPGEQLVGAKGLVLNWTYNYLAELSFISRKRNQETVVYGPYGGLYWDFTGTPFSILGNAVGFAGSSISLNNQAFCDSITLYSYVLP